MITVTKMKKKKIKKLRREYLKTWVEFFKVGVFLVPKEIYAKNSQVYMHY